MHSEPSSILMGQLEFAGARMRGSGSKFVLRSRAFSDISRRNMATLSGISSRCEKRERERECARSREASLIYGYELAGRLSRLGNGLFGTRDALELIRTRGSTLPL